MRATQALSGGDGVNLPLIPHDLTSTQFSEYFKVLANRRPRLTVARLAQNFGSLMLPWSSLARTGSKRTI
jgi:hypothetical protein